MHATSTTPPATVAESAERDGEDWCRGGVGSSTSRRWRACVLRSLKLLTATTSRTALRSSLSLEMGEEAGEVAAGVVCEGSGSGGLLSSSSGSMDARRRALSVFLLVADAVMVVVVALIIVAVAAFESGRRRGGETRGRAVAMTSAIFSALISPNNLARMIVPHRPGRPPLRPAQTTHSEKTHQAPKKHRFI